MTHFIKRGSSYLPMKEDDLVVETRLPVGTYIITKDMMGNFQLGAVDSFTHSSKLYGDLEKYATRILGTFKDRPTSTGVLLSGEKGSGKSLLAKLICMEASTNGVPTIIINEPWHGEEFNRLIQSIQEPCVILFDEFEKVYTLDEQQHILTLLDGVYPTKNLFIFTCNDKWKLDSNMYNRPSRIYYAISFSGLKESFIVEYCEDRLHNKTHIKDVVTVSSVFDAFNFDMLQTLVEEMNRYDETAQQAIKMLNINVTSNQDNVHTIEVWYGDIKLDGFYPTNMSDHPQYLSTLYIHDVPQVSVSLRDNSQIQAGDHTRESSCGVMAQPIRGASSQPVRDISESTFTLSITHKDMKQFVPKGNKYIFEKDGYTVVLAKEKASTFNVFDNIFLIAIWQIGNMSCLPHMVGSNMQHIRKLPANTNGKDYICGDVHGYYDHVMKLMDHVKFDSAVDRLFFVGDLIDRGPDNILLQLPFVYSVLGNHDYMMIRSVLDGQHPFIWYRNGGLWIESIDEANRVSLAKFLKKKMSLVIVVGTSTTDRFNIMHAQPHLDAHSPNLTDADVNRTPHMSSEELDEADIIWGRSILRGADDRNVDNLSPTYVGHSILSDLYRYGPIYYIDGGACFNDRLTFACHTERIMYNYHVATDTFSSVPYADIEDIRS